MDRNEARRALEALDRQEAAAKPWERIALDPYLRTARNYYRRHAEAPAPPSVVNATCAEPEPREADTRQLARAIASLTRVDRLAVASAILDEDAPAQRPARQAARRFG